MSAIAQTLTQPPSRIVWFWQFLRSELAPYRGRGALVVRMVAASTLVMIVCMTYRIPYAAYAALFGLTLSRESVRRTAAEARALILGSALGVAYAIVSFMLVLGDPMLRFLWVGASLFLAFYVISAFSNYAASARFAYLVVILIPLSNSFASPETKLETALWAVGAIALGSVIALLLEIVFAAFRRTDDLTHALSERLAGVKELLAYYVDDRPVDQPTRSKIERLAAVGTSRLRLRLQRGSYEPQHEQQMAAVVGLVGRLVDLAANLSEFDTRVSHQERTRIRKVAHDVAAIRGAVESGQQPPQGGAASELAAPSRLPLLAEIESTVSLIQEACTGTLSLSLPALASPESPAPAWPLAAGALSNPAHIKFALRGSLAAWLSYVIYNGLFWPGISTAVTTCLLTALTTVGASHQKQLLRFAGAIIGGFVIGMGAQVFILPNIDSIGAFTVLFGVVAFISAWFATAGPRLSYFGVQIAVAFYLINLQEFKIQTSLAVARDRVVGVLLGLAMMWLAFDLLWSSPAGVEMRKTFVSAIRSLAQLAREPFSGDLSADIERSYALRETINAQFDRVRSLADGVLFEFGPSRRQDLAWRDRIRAWTPQLRTLFVIRIAFLKYRLALPGFELPASVRRLQQEFDDRSATILEDIASRIETNTPPVRSAPSETTDLLVQLTSEVRDLQAQTFLALARRIDELTASLAREIVAA